MLSKPLHGSTLNSIVRALPVSVDWMPRTVPGVSARWAHVFAAVFSFTFLGCGSGTPPHADAAPASDTSALTETARAFLSTLNEKQRATASFPFDDSERTKWA